MKKSKRIYILLGILLVLNLTACEKSDTAGKASSDKTGSAATEVASGIESASAADTTAADAITAVAAADTDSATETSAAADSSAETESAADTASAAVNQVITAIESASDQPSFELTTSASLSLNGKSINGEYHMQSEVHIAQQENHENMQMSMKTSSDIDDIITYSYYKDGWYYVDGADGKKKEEKTTGEILSMISGVTDLVKESGEKIKTVDITSTGENTVYTYELPSYLAEDYLEQMVDSLGIEDLSGAQIRIEQAILETTVDANGVLQRQTASITGSVHKAIFNIPAQAEITADFRIPDTETLQIETW